MTSSLIPTMCNNAMKPNIALRRRHSLGEKEARTRLRLVEPGARAVAILTLIGISPIKNLFIMGPLHS